jgi:hypothetical protein
MVTQKQRKITDKHIFKFIRAALKTKKLRKPNKQASK